MLSSLLTQEIKETIKRVKSPTATGLLLIKNTSFLHQTIAFSLASLVCVRKDVFILVNTGKRASHRVKRLFTKDIFILRPI